MWLELERVDHFQLDLDRAFALQFYEEVYANQLLRLLVCRDKERSSSVFHETDYGLVTPQ